MTDSKTNPHNQEKLDMPLVYSWVIKNQNISLNETIEDIILNTENSPYLSNFVKNAIDNPNINHYLFYYPDADLNDGNQKENSEKIQKKN
jgi:hypothetical protein